MKQLLFIRYRKPGEVDAGGEQGTNTNYNVLCQLLGKENITVYYIHENHNSQKLLLNGFSVFSNFRKGYYYGLSPQIVNDICILAQDYLNVFIDRSIFGIIAKELRQRNYQGKIITFFHNVESVYFAAKISRYAPWRHLVIDCVTKNDRMSCDYSDTIIALNKRDKQEIENRYKRSPDILSPVVLKDKYNLSGYPNSLTKKNPVCLFLGTYFPMNVKGILWFVRNVLPHVNIQLQIIGKGMNAIVPKVRKYSNVTVFSDVIDLKPFIEEADFMLLPIFEGSGMKVKTCEALMYGKNIIGTDEAFEGYDLDFKRVGACCNSIEEFIKSIEYFNDNPLPIFNDYSRSRFLEDYSEDVRKKAFKTIFQ